MSATAFKAKGDESQPTDSLFQGFLEPTLPQENPTTPIDRSEPWQLAARGDVLELKITDNSMDDSAEDERRLLIRCGTALGHVKRILNRLNCLRRVDYFPDLGQRNFVARVHVALDNISERLALDEFDSMSDFDSAPATNDTLIHEALEQTAAREKVLLEFSQSESSFGQLLPLTSSRSTGISTPNPKSAEAKAEAARLGVSVTSRLEQWSHYLRAFRIRFAEHYVTHQDSAITVDAPKSRVSGLALLKTKTDDRLGWLLAGQALAGIRWQAKRLGITCSVFDQAFRSRHVRESLRSSIGRKGFAQAIIGIHP